jgi:Fic family protein
MWLKLGELRQQPEGYRAFIPFDFPLKDSLDLSQETQRKHLEAMRVVGKLDGICQLLPDRDFFLIMFVRKEAASSSQIEGTQATMIDAIEAEILEKEDRAGDVDDIVYYIKALNYGIKRFEKLPLSVRFVQELHEHLMKGARLTQNPFPGQFRYSQNWIGGTNPCNAAFVPPPFHEIPRAFRDLEKFIHAKKDGLSPLIKAALIHAQFETIHPFVDGNGRTGRILLNAILLEHDYPPLIIRKTSRIKYFSSLEAYDKGYKDKFERFLLDKIKDTFEKEQIRKMGDALDKAGVPLGPRPETFPKTTAALEEIRKSDAERAARKAEKASGGGGAMPKSNRDITKNYKKGGKVSSASSRADGCAIKGKTKGRMV